MPSIDKKLIILGDIEMGAGTLTDDFISDTALSALIRSLAEKPLPVDLVLNGDTFDFLKCPVFRDGKTTYPRHITPDISIEKLHLIKKAHAPVFNALRFFVQQPQKTLYVIIGNHDYELVYPEVQQELNIILKAPEPLQFSWVYKKHQVYIEHGQQYDLPNRLNLQRLFVRYHGKNILNPPWTFGLLHRFMNIKEEHPFLERIFPKVTLFQYHRPAAKKISRAALKFVLSSIFYYPFRALTDPTYSISQKITREMLHKLRQSKEQHFDMNDIIHLFKRKKRHLVRRYKLLILGHVHTTYIEERKHSVIIHPGSWRDEYRLDAGTGMLTPRTKNYVRIQVAGERLHWELVPMQIQRSTILFKDVVKDEKAAVCKAAAEENFSRPCCAP
ncbi:MAG: metallophosphoesterase [Nanoarchaeota archaeon]|nr:metallophosphoesterase [Nanoarchaeota archaeon]